MAVFMPRLGNDARIMATIGQCETYFSIGQHMDLMHRAPRRDMVRSACPPRTSGLSTRTG
jgi:hypothetical protein